MMLDIYTDMEKLRCIAARSIAMKIIQKQQQIHVVLKIKMMKG
jgi:hypothetical protein